MIQHIAARTRDACFWLEFWSLVSGFDGTFGYLDDRPAFYLRKLVIERSVGTGGLLPESVSEITVIVFLF